MLERPWPTASDVWDCAEPFVIGLVVQTLHQNTGLKRDGPALRLLNKHWKRHVSEGVLAIGSLAMDDSLAAAPTSMPTTTRIAQLDTTDFQWTIEQLAVAHKDVFQTHSLKRVQLNGSALHCSDSNRPVPSTRMAALEISSPRLTHAALLSMLDCLPLKELCLTCRVQELHSIVAHVPALRTLKLALHADTAAVDLSMLRSLDALHLRWMGASLCRASVLWGITSLITLQIPDAPQGFDWSLLAELPKLKHLSFSLYSSQSMKTASFLKLLSKLDTLEIDYRGSTVIVPDTFIRGPFRLKSLFLKGFKIQNRSLNPLTHLTQLYLAFGVSSSIFSIFALQRLRSLRLTTRRFMGILDSFQQRLNNQTFPELTVLTVGLVSRDRLHVLLDCITRLSKLEILGIKMRNRNPSNELFSPDQPAVLNIPTKLRELGLFGPAFLDKPKPFPAQSLISHLDSLWVETVTANDMMTRLVDELKETAPTLKVFAGSGLYRRFIRMHHPTPFESACLT